MEFARLVDAVARLAVGTTKVPSGAHSCASKDDNSDEVQTIHGNEEGMGDVDAGRVAKSSEVADDGVAMDLQSEDPVRRLRGLSRWLGGVTVLVKGRRDLVSSGGAVVFELEEEGSPRRCGGQVLIAPAL